MNMRETSQYVVAYIDMLGVTSRMQLSKDSQKIPLNKLYNLYRYVIDLCEKEIGIKDFEGMKIKIFSDNIIIVKKLDEEYEKRILTIKSLLNWVVLFQCTAASDSVGWLARGGIAIGELFFDERWFGEMHYLKLIVWKIVLPYIQE